MVAHRPEAPVIDARTHARTQRSGAARDPYAELKGRVKDAGLLDKAPGFIVGKMALNLVLAAIGLAVLFSTDVLWVQLLNAAFLGFVFGQFGFVAHDAGHRQAFATPRQNDAVGLIHTTLLIGMGYGWWLDKHNAHHANPNAVDLDPDIDLPVLAFSEEDALSKRGFERFMVKHQRATFFPLLLLQALHLRVETVKFLLRERGWRYRRLEWALFALHHAVGLGLVFWALPFGTAVAFVLVQQALFGFYLASVFAPNHKGMLLIGPDDDYDYLHKQVLTARNVRASPWVDFWYGGLNYQIEHHLFPTMARVHLRKAQGIIRSFCEERGIRYYETGVLQSYREILDVLHTVSAPLRRSASRRS
jgi:fatty acid desaturase